MGSNPLTAVGHDAPIQSPREDLLNSRGIAEAIHRVIASSPPLWSTRIGLLGRWGSGKTSILNLLRGVEETAGSIVITFSAWSASEESGVITQFYQALAERLKDEKFEIPRMQRLKEKSQRIQKYKFLRRWVEQGVDELVPIPASLKKVATEALSKLSTLASSWAKIGPSDLLAITQIIGARRVVVFIDDLDRADPKIIPKTLLALRELLDWPGFAFVIAFDKRSISSALSEYSDAFGRDADGFLEKVIDVPFEVPELTEKQRLCLAGPIFKACCDIMPEGVMPDLLPIMPSAPRRIKLVARLLGAQRASLARHAQDEVDWVGLSMYLIVKEANQQIADWVVAQAIDKKSSWSLWLGREDERQQKEEQLRATLNAMLPTSTAQSDADRVVEAAVRLLRHWDLTTPEAVFYWRDLIYKEPTFTLTEARELCASLNESDALSTLELALRRAADFAQVNPEDAAYDLFTATLLLYQSNLDSMAEAERMPEWKAHFNKARQSLRYLESLWIHNDSSALANAITRGDTCASLLNMVERWLLWSSNEGESELRARERYLANLAVDRTSDPDRIFCETDPFWNSHLVENQDQADMISEWRRSVRKRVIPRVVAKLCQRFVTPQGMRDVALGDDKLSPWLVESKKSPLYTDRDSTKALEDVFLHGGQGNLDVDDILAGNSYLYLKQLLFQTRSGSWGGLEDAKKINELCPGIIPAAWRAIVRVPAPYRMLSSYRKLRSNIVEIGVSPEDLYEPEWLLRD
ncbi:KAP family P-loop NTPase fold protein [Achromobacter insuavis]|uniref:KAP family P-loop NTPase fold protein n=1 Tax=Achromobacter insuavis TaxID=1287735 RepID=UPI000B0A9209|nr:P-loop NTPase fold protein [Achromobacter insuavis]